MAWECPECGDDDYRNRCGRCSQCSDCCECDDDFDADELGLDPEEPYDA